jgi:restriction endonuclease
VTKKFQRSTKSWLDHELVSKHIFEAILKQEKVQNLDVRHNVIIAGKSTKHQIDVYWKFTAASVAYFTIVEVKKQKRKVSKGDMFTFKGVLDDIPGRPKGLFISQRGYQKGALKVAKGYDIIPYELTEVTERPPVEITILSIAAGILRPETLSWEWTTYYTTFDGGSSRCPRLVNI